MNETLPISELKKVIDSKIKEDWKDYEVESILMELGVQHSELLVEKINLLKVLSHKPTLFYEDVLFFLHACEVMNNNVTDFESVPHITSLEAAFAIYDIARLNGVQVEECHSFDKGVKLTVKEILVNDGFSSVVWPFTCVGVTELSDTVYKDDMALKEKAIKDYIIGTYSK